MPNVSEGAGGGVSDQPAFDLRAVEPTLVFEPVGHTYTLQPEGVELLSVTTALKESGLIDYSMIPQDVLLNAARRGTAVHQALALLDEEALDEETVDDEIRGYIEAYAKFKRESGFVPALIEHRAFCRNCRYAGTLDRTGTIPGNGGGDELVVLDFKTGMVLEAHRLQLAAYANFLEGPRRFRRIALQLAGDGSYRVHEYPTRTYHEDFATFLSALRVASWKRAEGRR